MPSRGHFNGGDNNRSVEGLTATRDGKTSRVFMQAALNPESGISKKTWRYTRSPSTISGSRQQHGMPESLSDIFHCTMIPWKRPLSPPPKDAAQAEIYHLRRKFFHPSQRNSAGHGQSSLLSVCFHANIFGIASATGAKGSTYDCANFSIATDAGVVKSVITPPVIAPASTLISPRSWTDSAFTMEGLRMPAS